MQYGEIMRLPIYTFWALARNIDRLKAEQDLRLFAAMQNAMHPGDHVGEYVERMQADVGRIVEIEYSGSGFDRAGVERLKAMMVGNK